MDDYRYDISAYDDHHYDIPEYDYRYDIPELNGECHRHDRYAGRYWYNGERPDGYDYWKYHPTYSGGM